MAEYLVFFLTGEVDDELAVQVADRVRDLASGRAWAEHAPGFIDSAEDGEGAERTTGGYLRLGGAPARGDVEAIWALVLTLSRELGVGVEIQYAEEVLGRVHLGEPEEGLAEVMGAIA